MMQQQQGGMQMGMQQQGGMPQGGMQMWAAALQNCRLQQHSLSLSQLTAAVILPRTPYIKQPII